jgi:hypothetical protein
MSEFVCRGNGVAFDTSDFGLVSLGLSDDFCSQYAHPDDFLPYIKITYTVGSGSKPQYLKAADRCHVLDTGGMDPATCCEDDETLSWVRQTPGTAEGQCGCVSTFLRCSAAPARRLAAGSPSPNDFGDFILHWKGYMISHLLLLFLPALT